MTTSTEPREQTDDPLADFDTEEEHFTMLSYEMMKELELFDDLRYGDVKKHFPDKEGMYEITIRELECEGDDWIKVEICFEGIDLGDGNAVPKFKQTIEYNGSSKYAMLMCGVWEEIQDRYIEENTFEE
tara:strand:- start:642 stop:1028 length:387 start_codon:yes stop_codon:yes gene_type:complete